MRFEALSDCEQGPHIPNLPGSTNYATDAQPVKYGHRPVPGGAL